MRLQIAPLALLLGACTSQGEGGANIPEAGEEQADAMVAREERLNMLGTEPFWGGHVEDGRLLYTTPEDPEGTPVAVERFAGRGGLSFSGALAGQSLDMAVTRAPCSDSMSDRTYPFTVTLQIGQDERHGCGWSDRHPFEGPAAP